MSSQTVLQMNYPQILDGFCYSGLFGTRPLNGLNWYWNALANLEDVRLAADSYRPRHWIVPKNFIEPGNTASANIEPGKTIFYEFQVKEGSWLWGMQFCARFENQEVESNDFANTHFSVVVRQGSDLPFSDRPMVAAAVYSGDSADPFNTLKLVVNPLPIPRLIIPPAQLHVEISNDADPANSDFAVSCQLVLLFAEPKG